VYTGFWKPERKDHLEDPGIDSRIILRWIFMEWYVEAWTALIWFMIGDLVHDRDRWGGACECGNELLGYIKHGEFD